MDPIDSAAQREFAIEIVRSLRAASFEAYWAGGCVRDALLGHTPKDYDVATSARPEQVRDLFGPRRTIAVGAAFGVIVVLGPSGAGQIDVATFRQDAAYSDGRHPDSVTFSTAEADAQRRDFTINGLFFDPLDERVIDFVGGQTDLAGRVVRAIGDPAARFTEDKLRLLRAARFAATLDFALELETRQAVSAMADQITVVSAERIAAEMRLMLTHTRRRAAVELLREVGLLEVVLPELSTPHQGERSATGKNQANQTWPITLQVLDVLQRPSFPLALAALLQSFVDAAKVDEIGERWKLSIFERRRARWLVQHQRALVGARRMPWSQLQPLLISPGIDELLALHRALFTISGQTAPACDTTDADYCQKLLAQPRDVLDPAPLLTGNDLIAHGVRRGAQYKQLLDAVRAAQLDKQIHTQTEALTLVDTLLAAGADDAHVDPRE